MRAQQKNAQKYFLRQVMELWFSIAQNIGQNIIENPYIMRILMKTKDLLALEVSASSFHKFSKNQK